MSVYCTRGDCGTLTVTAEADGIDYVFRPEDVLRLKVFEKKGCDCVVIQREIVVGTTSTAVPIYLSGADTKVGEIIHKPKDFWYEVELNPYTTPVTIVGYDEDGPKLFRLYPEGADVPPEEPGDMPEAEVYDVVSDALIRAKVTGMFDGQDGYTPVKNKDYFDGKDGYTPQKGVDYYTATDKAEMVQAVLSAMPQYAGETEVIG